MNDEAWAMNLLDGLHGVEALSNEVTEDAGEPRTLAILFCLGFASITSLTMALEQISHKSAQRKEWRHQNKAGDRGRVVAWANRHLILDIQLIYIFNSIHKLKGEACTY